MKEFSKKEIDEWRNIFRSRGYPSEVAEMNERLVDYFVLPKELFQGIPNGLFRMTGKPEDGYVVGVSSEVPGIVKPYFAISEHDEFMVYGLGDKDRTLHSEQNIVGELEGNLVRDTYIGNKIVLYDHMVEKSAGNLEKWGFTQEDYDGFVRALDFLKGKV